MPQQRPGPRERLLETASRLFYAEGLHSIGVDRLVTEANVTRSTFYRHFPTKEALIEAYLRATDDRLRHNVDRSFSGRSAEDTLEALLDLIDARTSARGFRGCQFINAAAEYPDPEHPVHIAVEDHRKWFRETVTELATALGHPDPQRAGEYLVMLHDGALVAAELDDGDAARAAVRSAARELLLPGLSRT